MTASIFHCDRADWHMKTLHIRVTGQIWYGSKFSVFENILIQSLGCRAVYLTLMLCVMAHVLQTCIQNDQKMKIFQRISTFHCRGRQSVCRRGTKESKNSKRLSKKSQISTENIRERILSVGNEKLQMVKICIQNAVPACLVHQHQEHCVV